MKYGFIKVGAISPSLQVADCDYNAQQIIESIHQAHACGVRILVFPELAVTGYTCGDLFSQRILLMGARNAIARIAEASRDLDMVIVLGFPMEYLGKLYNCAAVLHKGRILGVVPKSAIPNYGEFYEARHFSPAPQTGCTVTLAGQEVPFNTRILFQCTSMPELALGIEICEDLWILASPSFQLCTEGATIIANLSASNETIGKSEYRRDLVSFQSSKCICAYIYATAGPDESTSDMVFSAHNIICESGSFLAESKPFGSGIAITEVDLNSLCSRRRKTTTYPVPQHSVQVVQFDLEVQDTALTRFVDPTPFIPHDLERRAQQCEMILTIQSNGLKKRLSHVGAKTAVIGVSGGLDSTLALLATARTMDMLQRDRRDILAVSMPCFGTTDRTRSNAEALCQALGVTYRCIDISESVRRHFEDIGHDPEVMDATYENAQARERTQVLMDLANQTGGIVIGTGDLSELALGWATYNGDHMSMYGVNSGIPKTLLRHIVKYYADTCSDEALRTVLLDVLDTPVSPELLPAKDGNIAQKTEDLVGPYELHDFFIYNMMHCFFRPAKIYYLACIAFRDTYAPETILKWLKVFYRRFFTHQFKRSCMPEGPKVSAITLSPRGDWRMPSDACYTLWMKDLETL